MLTLDKKGHLVQTSNTPVEPDEVVNRMHALIGILQRAEDYNDVNFGYENHLVLQMLREQLPTPEQANAYLKANAQSSES